MNIVAYCRVSTNKDDQLNSLDTQKRFFEEFAEKYNHNLVRVYADEGITGTQLKKRKEFQRLMNDARHGLFEMVVVKDISRFARNAVDFLQGIRFLKTSGIDCRFVNANLSTQDSEMILGTLALVAQEESANTSKRIKFSKKLNAEKGKIPNIVYGYDKTKGDLFHLDVNEFEAAVIKRIYNMYINDLHGTKKIAEILNDEGIRTKRNCKWARNGIVRILTNPIYTGKVINGKEEIKDFLTGDRTKKDEEDWMVTERPDLRIIDDESFRRADEIMEEHRQAMRVQRERPSNKYIFSTLIKCKHCGYSFRRFERHYKNTYIKWGCSGRNTNGVESCPNTTVLDEAELLQSIRAYFSGMLSDKQSLIKKVVDTFNRNYKPLEENMQEEKAVRAELDELLNKKRRFTDMYVDEIIQMDELKIRTKDLNRKIERLQNKLKLTQYNLSRGDKLEEVLNRTFESIEDMVATEYLTNAMLKQVIDKIVVDEEGHVDIYLKLFSDIGLDQTFLFGEYRT